MLKQQLKVIAQGSLIYGIGGIANRFLSFLLLPIFTHYLKPADYGVWAMAQVMSSFLGGIFTLGTGNSMGICFFDTEDPKERQSIVWTSVGLIAAISLLVSTFGFLFARPISQLVFKTNQLQYFIVLTVATLSFQSMTMPLNSYLRLSEKAKTYVMLTFTTTILTLTINTIQIVIFNKGIASFFETAFIVSIIMFLCTILISYKYLAFSVTFKWIPILVKIGYPSIFGLGAYFIIDTANRVMVQRLCGNSELGIYMISVSFGMMICLLVDAFGSAWPPYFVSFIKKQDEAVLIFGNILKYYVLIVGTVSLLFFVFARIVVDKMTAPAFHSAYTIVGIIAFAYMLKGCYLIVLPGIVFNKKLHVQSIIEWSAAAISIAGNFLFIPILKKEGVALSTLLTYATLFCIAQIVSTKMLKINYEWTILARFMVGYSIVALSSLLLFQQSVYLNLASNLLFFTSFVFFLYWFILQKQERLQCLILIKSIIPFFNRKKIHAL